MANVLTSEQRAEAEKLYAQVEHAQSVLWDAARNLERVIGCAVDTSQDFMAITLDDIIERDEAI